MEACVRNVGGGLTRRDGAEDIAEHTSAVVAVAVKVTTQTFYVLGERESEARLGYRKPQVPASNHVNFGTIHPLPTAPLKGKMLT